MAPPILTVEQVRSLFDYEPDTGRLIWRSRAVRNEYKEGDQYWNDTYAGREAGHVDCHRYRIIRIADARYRAHKLVWLHYYGFWPPVGIDHINGYRGDNRIANLRLADKPQNAANTGPKKKSTSIYKGVSLHNGRWRAQICVRGERKWLGYFVSEELAAKAYDAEALKAFGAYAYLNFKDTP